MELATRLLRILLLPPASLAILIAVGWWLRRRRPVVGRFLMVLGAALLFLASTPLVANLLLRSLEDDPPVTPERAMAAAAIVVLGGDMSDDAVEYGGDTVGALSLERLRYAALLQRDTGLPLLVTGGSLRPPHMSVALALRQVLVAELGVPVRWVESASSDTWENAMLSATILRQNHISQILVVTHAWHMRRVKIAFAAAGINVIPAPTRLTGGLGDPLTSWLPDAKALLASAYATHEWIGVLWYEWRRGRSPNRG